MFRVILSKNWMNLSKLIDDSSLDFDCMPRHIATKFQSGI